MHFIILSLTLAIVGAAPYDLAEQAKKYAGRFRPVQMLEELQEKPVPRLADFMHMPDFNKQIPMMEDDLLLDD